MKLGLFSLMMILPFYVKSQNMNELLNKSKENRIEGKVNFEVNSDKTYIPYTILKGEKEGPVFTIIGGIHGYEYPPIVATQELMHEIDPKKLSGTLIILPIANLASFYQRSAFYNPLDGKNLNNVFPGKVDGTISEKIAHWITTEVIANSDIVLDIHGGDANEDLLPFICYYNNLDNAEATKKAKQLSEASQMENVVSYPYNLTKSDQAKYAFKQAVQDDKVAFSIEAGKLGNVQKENVDLIKNAVYNVLKSIKMYSNSNQKLTKNHFKPKYFNNQSYVKVPTEGIFYSEFKSGDKVTKGEEIGVIKDEFGKLKEKIYATETGIILYKVGTPPVNKGETLFCIGIEE